MQTSQRSARKKDLIMISTEQKLREMVDNFPDLLVLSGSRLYGTNRPDSDEDLRGFVLPPAEYLIGVKTFECMEVPNADDHKIYSLRRFIDLVLQSDPQTTEMLFVAENQIKKITEIGRKILAIRSSFLSNRIFSRIAGYGYSEWRKAVGEQMIIEDRFKDDEEIIAWIRNKKHWDKDRMDHFVSWMDENRPFRIIPSKKDLGAKRKQEFEKYGFGVSSATHSIRLLGEAIELMEDGKLTFPRPNAELLKDIRYGKYTKEEVTKMREEIVVGAEEARKHSVLPDKPDAKKIFEVYQEIVLDFLRK